MRNKKRNASAVMALTLAASMAMAGCAKSSSEETKAPTSSTEATTAEGTEEASKPEETKEPEESTTPEETTEAPTTDPTHFIKLALNIYYNDGDNSYYANESGESITVFDAGQYTVSFDCDKDLSDAAKDAGVTSLTNLTAVYVLDMGASEGEQSPLKAANIMYDKLVVDGTELTITQEAPKSAFKASGIFDTNDPINSWDGSCVEGLDVDTANHVANFNIENPKKVELTFTLSDLSWEEKEPEESESNNTPSDNEYVNTMKFSDMDFSEMDALEFSKYLGNGINLGNTMEAYGHATLGPNASVSSYETFWGQPVTTADMMKGMKNYGFDSIRIPVSWTNMMDFENDSFTINEAYLDRVEEIVKYALDAEMIVIVNDHWDGGWWGMFGSITEATVDKAWTIYTEMWTQVAERFKDYSDMLIFESANEELGDSLNENSYCSDSGSLTANEKYEMTNKINQKFVDIVRKSGGNNDKRFLLIAGYRTDIDCTVDDRFKMPEDTVDGKLFVSVHYYTPWNYCGSEKDSRWGIAKDYAQMNELFKKMTKFTDAGYGVIIGEYAALPIWDSASKTSTLKENTLEFTTNLLDNCDIYNFVPMLWNTSDFFNKKSLSMINDEMANLFTSRCYAEEVKNDNYLDDVKKSMDAAAEAAPNVWPGVIEVEEGEPVAWIMWNGGAGMYSVGDAYNPSDCAPGIKPHDLVLKEAGEYTVSIDFTEGNDGLTFGALAIAYGEENFPGAVIDIKKITAGDKELSLIADPYTSSDDGHTTRVNLVNEWVKKVDEASARVLGDDKSNISATIIDKNELVGISNISITFEIVMPE